MKTLRRWLVCSLIVNLLFFGLSTLLVSRRGGLPYLISKVAPAFSISALPLKFIETPHYRGRRDHYAGLPGREGVLVFAGDSLISDAAWSELLERSVLTRGIGGDTVEGLRLRIGEVLRHQPRQLFIMIGVNDLLGGATGDDLEAEYEKLISVIRTDSPQTQLLLGSILPVNRAAWTPGELPFHLATDIIRMNRKLKETADGQHIVYIDLYTHLVAEEDQLDRRYTEDGVHLNGAGYLKWRDLLRPYLSDGNS